MSPVSAHISWVFFFFKEFVAEKGSETNSKCYSSFSGYIISYKCALNQVFGNTIYNTSM